MQLKNRLTYYNDTYGFQPVFKAGLHSGTLMIAEVGTIKKEIAYHGDVINTASRIQGLCNTYQSSLLVSQSIIKQLGNLKQYNIVSKGKIQLKGKEDSVEVLSIDKV